VGVRRKREDVEWSVLDGRELSYSTKSRSTYRSLGQSYLIRSCDARVRRKSQRSRGARKSDFQPSLALHRTSQQRLEMLVEFFDELLRCTTNVLCGSKRTWPRVTRAFIDRLLAFARGVLILWVYALSAYRLARRRSGTTGDVSLPSSAAAICPAIGSEARRSGSLSRCA
jgi:hypothetical protein